MTELFLSPADIPALVVATAGNLLGDANLSPSADFFSVGGDSLLAMHLVSRLARATGLRLRVRLLFSNPVLSDFAAEVAGLVKESGRSTAPAAAQRSDATAENPVSTPPVG